jgi:hypothetical protein
MNRKKTSLRAGILIPATIGCLVAIGQFGHASDAHVGSMKADRILFLGNSLTYHPANSDLGWSGNWGMASSSEANDYAHRVVAAIAKLNGGTAPAMKAVNVYYYGRYEQNYAGFDVATKMADLLAWKPNIVVVQLGENVEGLTTRQKQTDFAKSFANLLTTFRNNNRPEIFVRNTWWPDTTKDAIMKQATEHVGGVWVNLGNLTSNPLNMATSMGIYANEAVAGHPSDHGMKAMADGLFIAMKAHGMPEPGTLTVRAGAGRFYMEWL